MRKPTVCVAVLLWAAGLLAAWGASAQGGGARFAYIENQTGDSVALSYEEDVGGSRARTQTSIEAGRVAALDPAVLLGEVCAYQAPLLKPPEKLGCRTLKAGDHWVIR